MAIVDGWIGRLDLGGAVPVPATAATEVKSTFFAP
jgi:hypothetical protein